MDMISFRSCCFRMVGDRGHARRIIEPRVASHSECFQFQVFEGSIRPSRSLLWYTQAGILCIDTPYRNQNNPALHTDKIDGREDSHDSANRYTIDADSSKVNACSPSHRQSNAVMMHPTFPLASGPGRLGAVNARRAMPATDDSDAGKRATCTSANTTFLDWIAATEWYSVLETDAQRPEPP